MKDYIEELKKRNLIAQITHEDELKEHLQTPRTAYVGFDPTAPSLHVGHLLPLMQLARWQQAGHYPIALLGGATALVGDPTGKTAMRPMLKHEELTRNAQAIEKQIRRFLNLSSRDQGQVVNNIDWLGHVNYLEFLREMGPHFSVNRMLTAECFRQRMEHGLSFLEFNYMVLQAYDFYFLHKTFQCTVQLGGDDQWSNMLAGMELIRRLSQGQAFCITNPLLTTSDGKKMGKTEKGAVWLDPNMTSPYEYFQFWRNVHDDRVVDCLRYFTFLPVEEIEQLAQLKGEQINEAKIILAREAVTLVHGEEEARKAEAAASRLFGKDSSGAASQESEPFYEVRRQDVEQGVEIVDLLVNLGIFTSKAEVRRLIQQGGLKINDHKISDIKEKIDLSVFSNQGEALLKKGKKYYYRLRISE